MHLRDKVYRGFDPDAVFQTIAGMKNQTRGGGEVHTASLVSPSLDGVKTKSYNTVKDFLHKNGSLYLKMFPSDDTMNELGWKMHPEYLGKHVNNAIGKPAILNSIHFHPIEFNQIRSDNPGLPHTYDALIEITDPKLLKAYDEDTLDIPKYVSPAVWSHNPSENEIKDYDLLHIAFVDKPEFGIVKANVKGNCKGEDQCSC